MQTALTLTIFTGNAAFGPGPGEAARAAAAALREAADKLEREAGARNIGHVIRDENGNKVGKLDFETHGETEDA